MPPKFENDNPPSIVLLNPLSVPNQMVSLKATMSLTEFDAGRGLADGEADRWYVLTIWEGRKVGARKRKKTAADVILTEPPV